MEIRVLFRVSIVVICVLLEFSYATTTPRPPSPKSLDSANINLNKITLSGFSSGGTFAQQLQIAHSSLFSGIAVFSHAYYRCGPGDGLVSNYVNACTKYGGNASMPYNPSLAIADIVKYRADGLIEDPFNLINKHLYVYAGSMNGGFSLDTSLGILQVYEPFIQNVSTIRTRIQSAELVLPTAKFGGPCFQEADSTFFLANCGFSGAYDSLNFLLENGLKEPKLNRAADLSQLSTFNQEEFFKGVSRHDMDKEGYIFMPKNCKKRKCLLHLYFHGCNNGREFNGTNHIVNSGFLEVAELNDIIMVFPQVLSSPEQNPSGCWDTFGLTGPLYATRRGAQVTVIRNMLRKLLANENN